MDKQETTYSYNNALGGSNKKIDIFSLIFLYSFYFKT